MTLTPEAYVSAVRTEGEALARAAEHGLADPVAACPGWSVGDLLYHVGEVHQFWTGIVADNRLEVEESVLPPPPPDEDLIEWYQEGLKRACSVLAAADPAAACWTWAAQKNVAFVQRRMAQETAVHRWDGEFAVGTAAPIEQMLAVDGINEFADVMSGDGARPWLERPTGTVHVHCTDGEGEWLFEPGGDQFAVTRGHIKGDAALRGSASDLLLALWRRVPPETLDVIGDEDVARRFLGATSLS